MAEEKPDQRSIASMDTELGRMVVEQKLATNEEISECFDIRSRTAEDEKQKSFAQVLVDAGVVTHGQIGRIKKTLEESRRQQIPGYQLLSKLGSGAMATVFKARQLSLDRIVAIKVLPRKLSENAEYVEMFYKEGKAAAKLNHPNIVQAFDVGESAGFHYFVMEYVEGHTLYDEIASNEIFSETHALKVIIQIAQALEHAHKQGLIHRDVKPKNIMITPDGTAKLADMGLARLAADTDAAAAEAGRAFGTPYYISPEQIRGRHDIDFRTDIYSLGATLYHLLTGRVPFNASTPMGVMQKHLKEHLVPPDHINSALSAGMGEVVEVMMAKRAKYRYGSTTDLLLDLQAIADGQAPLQARKQIDAGLLSGLAEDEGQPDNLEKLEKLGKLGKLGNNKQLLYLVILAAALTVSVILNIILIAT